MRKALVSIFLLVVGCVPALAKSHYVYPVSCDVLWTAVQDTLSNPKNYGVMTLDGAAQRASFVVVGNLTSYEDTLSLAAKDGGCAMKLTMLQVGSDNSDERGFRKRVSQSLSKLQTARPGKTSAMQGQE
jgi:hypothetical protein